jgi:peptidoglycan/LPS O-acetylase OafA/YrhL
MQAKLVSDNYRPDIDGLRAISIVLVVFHHAVPEAQSGGFIGVDIFFVISGYLITSLLLKEIALGPVNYSAFFWRRLRRLVPALLVVLTAVLTIGYFILFPDEFASLGKHALAGLFFTSNILHLTETGYFEQSAYTKPLLHLWSLGVEEQFYIFWPFFLVFFVLKRKLLAATIIAIIASFALNIVLTVTDSTSAFYLPFGRLWEMSAGALLAICQSKTVPKHDWMVSVSRRQNLLASLGLGLILGGFFLIKPDPSFPGWKVLLPVIGTLLLLQSKGSYVNSRLLAHKTFVFLGLISYLRPLPMALALNQFRPDYLGDGNAAFLLACHRSYHGGRFGCTHIPLGRKAYPQAESARLASLNTMACNRSNIGNGVDWH